MITPRRGRRGVALVSVVSVLVLLMIVATPFLLSMRDSARRGERFLYDVKAEAEAESLFERARTHLVSGVEHVERKRLDGLGAGAGAAGAVRPPENATPTSDTLAELQLPADVLREFNQAVGREHRVWDLEITDAQAKFNLNSCSIGVLSNLLGRAELTDNLPSTDDRIPLSSVAGFPEKGGVVRIGDEAVRYAEADRRSNMLLGCERGYMADRPENGGASEHQKGAMVLHEAAVQIALRPFLWKRTAQGAIPWARYTNVYEARSISEMGVASLRPEEFDRIRRFLTAWSGNVVGDGWSNPQLVRNGIVAGDQTQRYAEVKNVRYFGPGTVVRLTDGVNDDYAIVTTVRGSNQVLLAGDIRHDYQADQTRMYSLSRAPLNVNTADVETLAVLFEGLGLDGKSARITKDQAGRLAQFLKERKIPRIENDVNPEVGVYRSWDDWVTALNEARDVQGILNGDDFEAVLRNSLNANDARLAFSTVPVTFRSFDVYEARAVAAVMGPQGQEIARREMTRVFEVSSGRSSTFVLETQADFQDQVRMSRDAKWFVTYPVNVNAYYDQGNEPASEYQAYAQKSRFPSTDRAPGTGHLQLREAAFRFVGREDRFVHFDEQDIPEGIDLETNDFQMSVDGPYSAADRKADLARFVQVPQRSEETEVGLAPFACSFWYQPKWSPDNSEHVIFDYGLDEQFINRVSLRFDPTREGGALVLGVSDATREQKACEVVYVLDDKQVDFEADGWYHIACTVYGCSPEMMELFVDGEQIGSTPLLTRLRNAIPGTGDIQSVEVEDASGFPDSGVLLLRAAEGVELIEYSQRSDNSFSVRRRKARSIDRQLDPSLEPLRSHPAGTVVQLYGFAAPLLTDVKRGGATLAGNLGPFRVFRMIGSDRVVYTSGGGQGGGTPTTVNVTGIAYAQGFQNQVSLTEWETGNTGDTGTLDDLGPQGTEGIAVIVSPTHTFSANNNAGQVTLGSGTGSSGGTIQNSNEVGGLDVVRYRVDASDDTGLRVTLLQRGLVSRHYDASQWVVQAAGGGRFIPSYDYGSGAATGNVTFSVNGQQLQYPGFCTAFVPIGVSASGASADYLDPADQEPQTGGTNSSGGYTNFAYVQVDSEWIKYDTFDQTIVPSRVTFLRDLTVPDLGSLFGFGAGAPISAIIQQSTGIGGGSGGVGSNTEPPHAQDGNDESAAPPAPVTGGTTGNLQPPPSVWDTLQVAARADFRSWEDRNTQRIRRIANTIARDHQSGAAVIACFATYSGNDWDLTPMGRRAYAGFDDLITLRDSRGADEQIRIQWGYRNWVAPTQAPAQTWQWDRPSNGTADMRRYPSQAWTRALKFPSREMPDALLTANQENFRWGKRYDDQGGTTPAFVDEVAFLELEFPADDRRDWVFVGEVPAQLYTSSNTGTAQQPLQFGGVDASTDEIPVHMPYYDAATRRVITQGLPIPAEVFRADGGLVRIEDELILYSEFDAEAGRLKGCVRGRFGTTAQPHQYGAIVFPVETYAFSTLTSDADESTASFELTDASDFPDDGYVRIDDGLEVVGYTEVQGNRLSGPLGRIDPGTDEAPRAPGNPADDKRSAGGLFRGRFGTEPQGYSQGAVVMAMPWRYYDRYAERSDDPENSYAQFTWTRENSVWKRVTWDELVVENVEVVALLRFSGGPPWDSDRIIRVGQQEIPKDDRRGWLYEITDPAAENLLNVEADRLEARFSVRFAQGAYDRTMTPRPNQWKETPWLRKVVVEYVSPSSVLSQE